MKKSIIIVTLSLLLAGCGKETDYVTDLTLSDKSISIETDFFDDMEAIVNVKGNASTEVTAVSSDESLVSVEAWADDEEPGLNYIDLETYGNTGEAEITVTTVGTDKHDRTIEKKFKVTVVEELEEEDEE